MLVIELGFGEPLTQVWIEDGGRRARVDLLLDGHVFEFDGRQKYLGVARGGFARWTSGDACGRRSSARTGCARWGWGSHASCGPTSSARPDALPWLV